MESLYILLEASNNLRKTPSPCPEYIQKLVSNWKEKRRIGKNVDTLKKMSIQCLLLNKKVFINNDYMLCISDQQKNPFKDLSGALVKEVVDALLREPCTDEVKKATSYCFLLQVLNSNTVECHKLAPQNAYYHEETTVDSFRHMLQNCPNIKQAEISKDVWDATFLLPRLNPSKLIRIMALQWPNLAFLKVENSRERDGDFLLQEISRHIPLLNCLEMVLCLERLTMKGVQHFFQMKKLKNLGLHLRSGFHNPDVTILAHAIGQIPALEKLNFLDNDRYLDDLFLDIFGTLYPDKKFTIASIRLEFDLKSNWPTYLSLEELSICKGYSRDDKDDCSFKNLLASDLSVSKLGLNNVPLQNVYKLLGKFGPTGLKDLAITMDNSNPLDAFRVMAACPKLRNVELKAKNYAASSDIKIAANIFEHCKNFSMSYDSCRDDENNNFQKLQLLKMYLTGSKEFLQKLEIESTLQLEVILWALQQKNQTILDKVEEVNTNLYRRQDSQFSAKFLKLVLLLIERSPFLQRVQFPSSCGYRNEKPPSWFLEMLKELDISFPA